MENNIIVKTEQLILRKFKQSDLTDLYEYLSDAEVVKFVGRELYVAADLYPL